MAQQDLLSTDFCAAPWKTMELVTAFCLAPALDRGGEADPTALEISEEVQELVDDLQVVFTAENRLAILHWIQRLDADREQYLKSLLLWLDVIEEVAFEVEKDLGDSRGAVKLRRVKGAVFYLLEQITEGKDVPGIPHFLNRFVLHLVIRGTVEFIVTLDNPEKYEQGPQPEERKLWGKKGDRPSRNLAPREETQDPYIDRLRDSFRDSRGMVAFLKWWEPKFERFANWIMDKMLSPPMVSQRFKSKVDELMLQLEKNIDKNSVSQKAQIDGMFTLAFSVIQWIGRHGPEVRAAIDAFSIALHITSDMSKLARDRRIEVIKAALILRFDDLGLRGPHFRFMLGIFVDILLEAVTFLYQKQRERPA